MKVAALDLGSNTFLCLIAEVADGQVTKVYSDHAEVVRLGQGLEKNGSFHPEALTRADRCLLRFSEIIKQHRPEKVLAMATSAARDASNKNDLFRIADSHGIPLEIIPGDREAEITYQGALSSEPIGEKKHRLLVDIGGGSTEFIFGSGKKLEAGRSYDIGCVRLTERFITEQPTPDDQIQKVIAVVDEKIINAKSLVPADFKLDEILAVAGTPTSLAAAEIGKFDAGLIEGFLLDKGKLRLWLSRLRAASVPEKVKMGIPEGRADVILIGVVILLRCLELFGVDTIKVSTKGVRYGIALELDRRYRVN